MTSRDKSALIAGAGIAGPTLALFLTRAGYRCTIVERAADFRSSGQQIDVAGEALKVLKYMGCEAACWSHRVEDGGIKFVDGNDVVQGAFPAGTEAASPVKELEIMRPDLAGVFYSATKDDVEYIFTESIAAIRQGEKGVTAKFSQAGNERTFDLLVAADGLRSSTRELAFGNGNTKIVTYNLYAGYFSIPWEESDGDWSRWYNAPGGRCVTMRPNIKEKTTSAYLCQVTDDAGRVATMPVEEQKREIAERFKDAGWEAERVLKYLFRPEGDRWYCQEAAQTRSEKLVKGRVALAGDAGYCPAPISGQGTTLALIGAYILAGCIASHDDVEEALREYERQVRPFIKSAQNLPPGAPWIVNPQTSYGIKVLNQALKVADVVVNYGVAGKILKLISPLTSLMGGKELVLPEYPSIHV